MRTEKYHEWLGHSCLERLRVGWRRTLYALHRFALYLEERGHLYYLNKKPRGGGGGCFVAFQQMIEPRIQHVIHVSQETRLHADEGAPPAKVILLIPTLRRGSGRGFRQRLIRRKLGTSTRIQDRQPTCDCFRFFTDGSPSGADAGHSRKTLARPVRSKQFSQFDRIGLSQDRPDYRISPGISWALITEIVEASSTIEGQ